MRFQESTIRYINSLKAVGWKPMEVFHVIYQFCGRPERMWCIYFGSRFVLGLPTRNEAEDKISEFYENPSKLLAL